MSQSVPGSGRPALRIGRTVAVVLRCLVCGVVIVGSLVAATVAAIAAPAEKGIPVAAAVIIAVAAIGGAAGVALLLAGLADDSAR